MPMLKVTITAQIPVPDTALEQARATLSVAESLAALTQGLRDLGATSVAEALTYKSNVGRKPRAKPEAAKAA